ncbi:Rap1a/Tai family immunity protein [Thiogranum longum]|uniref:Rap1a/Tai family immunity protein n=1 Tax=Thiogranum longum TaxID=1537524 RepID=UPI0010479C98|nr:Rap1a/Tai family immunity protein [Thiogranum longum]
MSRVPMMLLIGMMVPLNTIAAGSAETLLSHCKGVRDSSYCSGYIAGFYDGRTTNDYGKKELMSCPPTKPNGMDLAISYTQMKQVFIKWAEAHPENLHWADWQAVRQAFAEAWPCP